MRNKLIGWAVIIALAIMIALPISTGGQEKKDNSLKDNSLKDNSLKNNSVGAAEESSMRARSAAPVDPSGRVRPMAPATAYDWTGAYIGGHLGWGSGRADTTFTPLPSATAFIDLRPTTLRPDPDGFSGGTQGGYNWQTGHFVVGAEADISWSRISGTVRVTPITMNNGSAFPGAGFLVSREETKWFGTLRPRAGVAFDRVLLYGTAGLAYGHVDYAANADFRPGTATTIPFFQYPAALSRTKTGWTAGGGAEVGINHHWSFKAEYLYFDFGRQTFTASPVPVNPPFQVAYSWETKMHNLGFGLNFRF